MSSAQWTMLCPRDRRYPVLPLEGRRCVPTPWPPNSACTVCWQRHEAGYTGPLRGDRAMFPDPRFVLVCTSCAMEALGLTSEALGGHVCHDLCTDRVHAELLDEDPSVLGLADVEARRRAVAPAYSSTAWRVLDVSSMPGRQPGDRPTMAVWLEIDRPLEWPDELVAERLMR